MSLSNNFQNGSWQHWVVVRPEPPGQWTARVVGLPEITATADAREQAVQKVRDELAQWLATGQLVPLELAQKSFWEDLPGRTDPNDPLEKEYVEELDRNRREDLERTLREYEAEDQKCSGSSSTPTT